MGNDITIYAAGNPNLYPLEYYNAETKSYEGLFPELFERFSSESGYNIIYYSSGEEDLRERLIGNTQVDFASGCAADELSGEFVEILNSQINGETVSYGIALSKAAPETFKAEFKAFISSVEQNEKTGMILSSVQREESIFGAPIIIGLCGVILLLIVLIALISRKYRRRLREFDKKLETDPITGLGNSDYLLRGCKQLINDKNRVLYSMFYFYINVDNLRSISGSDEADRFLCHMAAILDEYTLDTDILSRVSDDGFVIVKLSSDMGLAEKWVVPIINRICGYSQNFRKPYDVNVSVGVYNFKQSDRNLNEIILNASQSAHSAYNNKVPVEVYTDEVMRKQAEEKKLQADIGRAFSDNEIEMYIQFYINAKTSDIVGGEALSRWNHPEKGFLTPERFVPLMEREGAISRLDYYALNKVCAFLEELNQKGIEDFFISCNFSRDTFSDIEFVEKCFSVISKYKFNHELLIFEITESLASKNVEQLRKNVIDIKKYGVSIAIDDFGEGFTSFFDIQQYPINGIKLDRSLVNNVNTKNGYSILKAMVQVGHELGLTILAEGVETDEQVEMLKKLDCDVIQGYRFFAPIPKWEAENIIMKQNKTML